MKKRRIKKRSSKKTVLFLAKTKGRKKKKLVMFEAKK